MISAAFPPPDPAMRVADPLTPDPLSPPSRRALSPARKPSADEPYSSPLYLPRPEVRWGLGAAALSLIGVAFPLGLLILAIDLGLLPYTPAVAFFGALGSYLLALLVPLAASRWHGLGRMSDDYGLRFRWVDIPIGIGMGLGIRLALVVVLGALSPFLRDAQGNIELQEEPIWFVLSSVIIPVVVAPFVEEVLCRGIVMRAVRNRLLRGSSQASLPSPGRRNGAIVLSMVISTLVFAMLHGHQIMNLATAITLGTTTMLAGFAHSWVATKTGRLGAAIISHATMNGSAVLLLVLVQSLR